jgi:RHS repeat-associated protein
LKSATVNGNAATLNYAENFTGNATLSSGNNITTASGTDGSNNTITQTAQVSTKGPSSTTLTYDSNGNMTSDGTNTYAWDAENRLIKITYPGTGNNSQFTYDGLGHCVDIVETSGGTVTSTKQFVWCGNRKCESRTAGGSITSQYFSFGQTISGTNYFYTKDHLGSIKETTDNLANIQAQYSYDSFGRSSKLQGGLAADFQYAGYYVRSPSGLQLTVNRAYNSNAGRWINRDPVQENGGLNLFAYVNNNPISFVDPFALRLLKGYCQKNDYKRPEGDTGTSSGTPSGPGNSSSNSNSGDNGSPSATGTNPTTGLPTSIPFNPTSPTAGGVQTDPGPTTYPGPTPGQGPGSNVNPEPNAPIDGIPTWEVRPGRPNPAPGSTNSRDQYGNWTGPITAPLPGGLGSGGAG